MVKKLPEQCEPASSRRVTADSILVSDVVLAGVRRRGIDFANGAQDPRIRNDRNASGCVLYVPAGIGGKRHSTTDDGLADHPWRVVHQ
ncbi:hypothetical protein D3C75_1016850 [compost metagenome]